MLVPISTTVIVIVKSYSLCFSSYTTFQYSNIVIKPTTIKAGQNVTVTANVMNIGNRTSDEVIAQAPLLKASLVPQAPPSSACNNENWEGPDTIVLLFR